MTKEEAIFQLENLKEHCESMILGGSTWKKDVAALNVAIKELKKDTVLRESHEHDIHVLRKELKRRTVKLERIIEILNTHNADSMPEDPFYIDQIREVLSYDN